VSTWFRRSIPIRRRHLICSSRPFETHKTIVAGIGNIIRSDDGVGVHALRQLQKDPRVPRDVTFLDAGTMGLELLGYVRDATRLLLIDAVDVGKPVGTVVRMNGDELRGQPCGGSVHQLAVADLITTLPLVSDPAPQIVLLGIQTASTQWGTVLSGPVEAALESLVEAVIEELSVS